MAGKDLEKFIERYPTYIEALEMLEQKDQHIAELEQELAELKEMSNLIWIDLFHLNNDNNEWTKSLNKYKEEAQEKLTEMKRNG